MALPDVCLVADRQSCEAQPAEQVRHSLTRLQAVFELQNDLSLVYPLTEEIQQSVARVYGEYDESYRFRLAISLEEAVTNAMIHGNLEISSESRISCDSLYYELVAERTKKLPYRDRRTIVDVTLQCDQIFIVVRDQGPGFDVHSVPDPTAPENLEKPCGRGLALMRNFMDSVVHNAIGNVVMMKKHPPNGIAG